MREKPKGGAPTTGRRPSHDRVTAPATTTSTLTIAGLSRRRPAVVALAALPARDRARILARVADLEELAALARQRGTLAEPPAKWSAPSEPQTIRTQALERRRA